MNILYLTNQFPSKTYLYKGSFVFSQLKELSKHNSKTCVLTPNYAKDEKKEIIEDIIIHRFRTFTKRTNDPLLRDLFSGFRGTFALIFFIIFQTLRGIHLVCKHKIDIIHAHWILPSGFSSIIIGKIMRKKVVITIHGSDINYCGEKRILKVFTKFVLRKSDFIIGVSETISKKAENFVKNKRKIKTIYIGIVQQEKKHSIDLSQENKIPKKIKIIFVGSLYPVKGIKYLMQIIKKLSKKHKNIIFQIIGDGVLMSELHTFINSESLNDYCIIYGFLDNKKTLKLINEADIAIQTSISEGLSIFIQEAIYYGKAVVASDVGGTSEIVIDNYNGFLVKPGDVDDYISKLEELINSPELLKKMKENSKKIASEKLILENNMKKIVEIYEKIQNNSFCY
ncbi:MAG: glycosyltransferase family 4 protein [Candidatus Helarchaeota archaeon]